MINLCFVFGTRPEYLKIVEVIKELKKNKKFNIIIISSNQQRLILKKYVDENFIDINLKLKNFDNDAMFVSKLISKLNLISQNILIDFLFVQGDTNTAYGTSLFGFFKNIPVIHLEAGLRTFDLYNPFPEEFIRQSISKIAKIHFAQNKSSKKNLENEGIFKNIFVVGNPGVDHLVKYTKENKKQKIIKNSILVTMHRRESINSNLEQFIHNLKLFLNNNPQFYVNWPLHSNPNILMKIEKSFKKDMNQIRFSKPLEYSEFQKLMLSSQLIITDSGGVQEEAAFLGKPLLIARDKTERVDIINLNVGILINADGSKLQQKINHFIKNKIDPIKTNRWRKNQGSGNSSTKIYDILNNFLPKFKNK